MVSDGGGRFIPAGIVHSGTRVHFKILFTFHSNRKNIICTLWVLPLCCGSLTAVRGATYGHTEVGTFRSPQTRLGAGKDRRGNEVSKVGRSKDRFYDALTSRSTRSNHFRRDVGQAGVRADNGNNVPKKLLLSLPVATDNSKKN